MPRNVNYNLIAERQGVIRDLNKQSGIVDAIRRGKITKAEFYQVKT